MRYLICGITAVFAILLTIIQTTILHGIEIFGVIPNLVLVAVVCYSLLNSTFRSILFGIFCGVLLDCVGGRIVGLNTLLCMYIAYVCGITGEKLFNNNVFVAVLFVVCYSFLFELANYLLHFALWGNTDVLFAVFGRIIPTSVYNGLAALVLYPIVYKLSDPRGNAAI